MAGDALAADAHPEQQRILVAVDQHFLDVQRVAARFTFAPERLARARPEPGLAGFDGAVDGFRDECHDLYQLCC